MSIAVSAIVRPSRVHRILLGACALVHCCMAVAFASGAPSPSLGGPFLGLLPALAAAFLVGSLVRPPKTHQIDISGIGDLRVTVQQDVAASGLTGVALLPGTGVWPLLMVLRYGQPGGVARVLVVARDAVDGADWRALAVALGALGHRPAAVRERDNAACGGPRDRAPRQPMEQTTGHVQ
jgi:hypothetical protein